MMVLDSNEVVSGLWIGGFPLLRPYASVAGEGFSTLVLCAEELQPKDAREAEELFPGVGVIRAPMDDTSLPQCDFDLVEAGAAGKDVSGEGFSSLVTTAFTAAKKVAVCLKRGEKVLVTCHKGRNRSGLVVALALWMRLGCSGKKALDMVQSKRLYALGNPHFAKFLEMLPAPRKHPREEA